MTSIEAKAAAKAIADHLKQAKERRRDQLQNLAKGEA